MSFTYKPTNPNGLPYDFIEDALTSAIGEWDSWTNATLVNSIEKSEDADFDSIRDGTNEVTFGDYPETGVIAVCRMWIIRGKPSRRRIVELDLLFDTDYT